MQLISKEKMRGDTLVEVLFAFAIFSLIAVGGLSIMNQGSATAQRSLEITLVKQQIDAQAEALRFLNSSYISAFGQGSVQSGTPADAWKTMIAYIDSDIGAPGTASDFGNDLSCSAIMTTISARNYFILNAVTGQLVKKSTGLIIPATTFSKVNYTGTPATTLSSASGIWIEGIHSKQSTDVSNLQKNADFVDFHIRACWDSPGQSIPVKLGTIVRLYEPLQ